MEQSVSGPVLAALALVMACVAVGVSSQSTSAVYLEPPTPRVVGENVGGEAEKECVCPQTNEANPETGDKWKADGYYLVTSAGGVSSEGPVKVTKLPNEVAESIRGLKDMLADDYATPFPCTSQRGSGVGACCCRETAPH